MLLCSRPFTHRQVFILINLGYFYLSNYTTTCSFLVSKPSFSCRRDKFYDVAHHRYPSSNQQPTSIITSSQISVSRKPSESVTITAFDENVPNQATQKSSSSGSNGATPRYIAAKAIMSRNNNYGSSANSCVAFAVDRLESNIQYTTLSPRDRSFARLLVTTAERRLGQIDIVLQHCQKIKSNHPQKQRTNVVDAFIEAVLRIGAVQILFLNTPSHAAVKETVDTLRLYKDMHVPQPKINYVNAILRRLSSEGEQLLSNTTDITVNAAPWLIKEWKVAWGDDATNRIVTAAMEESPRCLTVNMQQLHDSGNEPLSKELQHEQIVSVASLFDHAEMLPQGTIRIVNPPPGSISTWPMYQEGMWWCQDPAATIPAIALYQALSCHGTKSVHAMHVIDLCAAPGGKTAQLSNYNFASVTAIEASSKRCERLIDNMQRLRKNWNIVVTDGCDYIPEQMVDAVLVDVPCTATGTGSKRPDVLRRDSDITELLQIQQKLVAHAANHMIRVGGIIVYATCSLLKQESEDQVTKLLSRTDGSTVVLKTLPFQQGEIPGFDDAIDSNGWIRVLPGALEGSLGQCDGFFVAKLQRIS